ncbi:NAD-dependent histone deacetylase sir2 [Coemansia sp. Benny D115]|nr:NAD-dependent histone deacetylase sir2 [Coemansia sp. Benny D115]
MAQNSADITELGHSVESPQKPFRGESQANTVASSGDSVSSISKRRDRGDSVNHEHADSNIHTHSRLEKSSKRHRADGLDDQENDEDSANASDTGRNFKEDNDEDSDEDDGDHLGADDKEVNVDGSCAPSPLNRMDTEDEEPAYTRFTEEEMVIIRAEARALGMGTFLEEYVVERGVSLRALLEVFGVPPMLIASVAEFQLLPLLTNQMVRFYRNRPKLPEINTMADVIDLLKRSRRIMVLTGAGVSVSCGIPDFRSPTGIYTRLNDEFGLDDPQQMFDIEYFRETPELFYSFAKELYPYNFTPAPTHAFNIDTLEHVQGIKNVLNCHGSFATATCIKCGYKCDGKELEPDIMAMKIAYCPKCDDRPKAPSAKSGSASDQKNGENASSGTTNKPFMATNFGEYNEDEDDEDDDDDDDYGTVRGIMKPDITFFGEKLPDQFDEALLVDREKVDLLLVMGSSLKVAPVSDIMGHLPHNVPQIVINKTPILHLNFDVQLLGDADDIVAYLARECQWDLQHPRIPGQSTLSKEFAETAVGARPLAQRPEPMVIPIKAADGTVVEKKYGVPEHWHPFPSAVITPKDLYVASGDARVRLAVDSSDEDEESAVESSDDDEEEGLDEQNDDSGEGEGEGDGSEDLARDISKATV